MPGTALPCSRSRGRSCPWRRLPAWRVLEFRSFVASAHREGGVEDLLGALLGRRQRLRLLFDMLGDRLAVMKWAPGGRTRRPGPSVNTSRQQLLSPARAPRMAGRQARTFNSLATRHGLPELPSEGSTRQVALGRPLLQDESLAAEALPAARSWSLATAPSRPSCSRPATRRMRFGSYRHRPRPRPLGAARTRLSRRRLRGDVGQRRHAQSPSAAAHGSRRLRLRGGPP